MKLRDYLSETKTSIADFARRIGVDERVTVRRYLKGERIPTREVMDRIAHETKGAVQPNDFYVGSADQGA